MVDTILSLAKTTRPTLAMVAPRERLFHDLDTALAASRALWIAGPPGSGKTTLVASYLNARARPSLWYQLDAGDGDIATFLYYLRQTALKHSPLASTPIPALSAGDERDWLACARRMLRAIFARFERGLALVFDNHEEIAQHSALHGIVALAIEEAPPGRAVILVSRNPPPSALARAQMNRNLQLLPSEALRLTADECRALATLRNAPLPLADLAQIQNASAGWVAGTILLIEHAKSSATPCQSSGVEGVLYDYVAHEIFQRFDEHVQRLLLEVCWTRRLSLALAEAITGDSRIRQILIGLALNNYFVTERDDNGQHEYILHPLLRDFLQARANAGPDRRRVAAQQLRCAELLLESGDIEEAVELLVMNLAWDRLEAVIIGHAQMLVAQARRDLLRAWIEELPLDRVAVSAWLTYWQGMSNLGRSQHASRRSLERALRLFVADHDHQGMLLAASGLIELVLTGCDDFSILDEPLQILRSLLETTPAVTESTAGTNGLVLFVVASALRNPAGIELSAWLARAEAAVRTGNDVSGVPAQRIRLVLAGLLSGASAPVESELAELLHADDDGSLHHCHAHLLANLYELLHGEPTLALMNWQQTLSRIQRHAAPSLLRLARIGVVAAALLANRPSEAATELAQVHADLDTDDKLSRCLGHYVISWAALCADDVITAFRAQQQAVSSAVELGIPFLEVLCRTALAQLLFQCRDARAGSSQLRRVHAIARDIRNPLLEHLTLLVYGEVAVREKRPQSGVNALRYAFGLGRQHGYFNLPWWHPRRLADLCVLALEHDVEIEFVRHLVRRHGLRPQQPPQHLEHWPWLVTVRSFGGLSLHSANGSDLLEAIGQGRPAQLFKLIVGSEGQGLRSEVAAEIMWPHVDSEYALKSLTINLHRLRRQLGFDNLVQLRDGRLSLNADLVWLDTRAFDQLCANIIAGRAAIDTPAERSQPHRATERLFDLYRGPWLGDDDAGGCSSIRARLRGHFLDAVAALLTATESAGPLRARALIERALQCEPGAEILYVRLMRLAMDDDDRHLALDAYARCREALRECDTSPGAELETLYAAALAAGAA